MTRIFLIGYMGAGKTTLGKVLSKKMHLSFIDMDQYIEERFHRSVRQIFAESGEEMFRNIERNILHEVGCFEDVVVATGGGVPCFFDNMQYMNSIGDTVFLSVNENVLYNRLKLAVHTRPVLKGKNGDDLRAFIHEGLQKRLPYYSQAKHTFCADELENREQVVRSADRFRSMLVL